MKRKRFEKLMISQHKSQARDIRQAVRTIIELRHYSEGHKGILMVYNKKPSALQRPRCTLTAKCMPGSREARALLERSLGR